MIRAFLFSQGAAREVPLDIAAAGAGKAGWVWIHLDGREAETAEWLRAQADIPPVACDALLAHETRPRADLLGDGAVINLRGLGTTPDDDPDALVSTRFWADQDRVVSLSFRTSIACDRMIDRFLAGELCDPAALIVGFASQTSALLDPDIAKLGDAMDDCEVGIDTASILATRRRVTAIRSQAISYRRFLAPQRQALERLAGADLDWLTEDNRIHLREAADRAARMTEELEATRERAALIHEELTDRRAELIDTRSLIISIAALIFLPVTFVTGLLGMNVDGIPFQHKPWAFWGVTGFCLLVTLCVLAWFVKARWIRGR